ncbi:hypothetical protein S40293_11419 [Stachybotrys chartarum IBT 40293]|nr:hypothetical protein S40293_11419 [Stachybotrys chartarum IBT 40293]
MRSDEKNRAYFVGRVTSADLMLRQHGVHLNPQPKGLKGTATWWAKRHHVVDFRPRDGFPCLRPVVLAAVEKVNHAALNDAPRPVQSGEAVGTRQLDRSAGWKGLAHGPTSHASETGWLAGLAEGSLKGRNRGGPLEIVGAAWT